MGLPGRFLIWPGRIRTCDLLIQSQAFYQLNYGPSQHAISIHGGGHVKPTSLDCCPFAYSSAARVTDKTSLAALPMSRRVADRYPNTKAGGAPGT